ncbi:MAG: GatB/YqeY domain-containing protein [Patescibacteria group bacterium]|nr:GatB/YqeY domain-containing protein [Patescibacteria group bacterium]MDD5121421.1 GatB/YqeY domain-containing protein [Patescibacteria group bacterium]MDD5221893.1 GatB/YqeY domain-containing protein [Patescibacteria group bacterium]MDD5395660.1 GatB/YqeY domain-containing protein [Patescibacteria group bacterium]
MTLFEKILEDLKQAMIKKDEIKVSALRMLKASLQNLEIELKAKKKELTDELTIEIVSCETKRRKESIEAFDKGGRQDLAQKEKKELEILSVYLPEQLSEEKLRVIIQSKIKELSAAGPQDFGKVMGAVSKETKGKADGNKVSALVKEELSK